MRRAALQTGHHAEVSTVPPSDVLIIFILHATSRRPVTARIKSSQTGYL